MKLILERNLDFRQFQNLVILTVCLLLIFFGVLNTFGASEYFLIKGILLLFIVIFIMILLTRKGLIVDNDKLYYGIFLFGWIIRRTWLDTSKYQTLNIGNVRMSTNYNYSYDIKDFHRWEPDLNVTIKGFLLSMTTEDQSIRQKIIGLTKPHAAKMAVNFIVENTNLTVK